VTDPRPSVRLRQAVLAASDLEAVARELAAALSLGEPFRDPGVGEFGLANVVFAIGDCFIEIVSPTRPGTAAGRWLERRGADGGYMVLFDLEDPEPARARANSLGVREVWHIDLPDISGTHLHPADMSGAIVSLDGSRPYGTWRWGGPQWTERTGRGSPGRLMGITVAVKDPHAAAERWGAVLGAEHAPGDPLTLVLSGSEVRFVAADGTEGITAIAVDRPAGLPGGAPSVEVGGVRLELAPRVRAASA